MALCKGRTRNGKRCRNQALEGSVRCGVHPVPAPETPESTSNNGSKEPEKGPNELAVLRALAVQDRIKEKSDPRWQMLVSLAFAVDKNPSRAALWSAYRDALNEMMKDSGGADPEADAARKALRAAAEVGDT